MICRHCVSWPVVVRYGPLLGSPTGVGRHACNDPQDSLLGLQCHCKVATTRNELFVPQREELFTDAECFEALGSR